MLLTSAVPQISAVLRARLGYRIRKDHGLGEVEANQCLDASLGFLQRCAEQPQAKLTPTKQEDIGWHAFILHTRDYAAFCQQIAGRFIHHEPTWPIEQAAQTCDYQCESELSASAHSCDSGPANDCGTTDCNSDGNA